MSEPAEETVAMPAFIRRAILAQGKYDPAAIEEAAQAVDLEAAELAELRRVEEAARAEAAKRKDEDGRSPERKWYEDL